MSLTKEAYQENIKNVFNDYIDKFINNEAIVKETKDFLFKKAPQRFWTKPASATGRYHPDHDNGFGGSARHSVSCAKFVTLTTLKGVKEKFTQDDIDCIKSACFLHDTSVGKNPHGEIAAQSFWEFTILDFEIKRQISLGIANHMGAFGPNKTNFPVTNQKDFFIAYCICHADLAVSRNSYLDKEMQDMFKLSKEIK